MSLALPALESIAARVVREFGAAPCAVVACGFRRSDGWHVADGAHGRLTPDGPLACTQTPFDLASVTKPFAALTLARLVRQQLLTWDTQLGVPLRDVHGTPSAHVSLELLAAHRAGLDGHRPLYRPLKEGRPVDRLAALREAGMARRPDCQGEPPSGEGFEPTYSDLGYLLIGEAMSRSTRTALDLLIEREVCEPLALGVTSSRRWGARDSSFLQRVAPTEVVSWRGGVVRGAVHDENAWAIAGDGVCAHAGLFGTAADVVRFGTAVLDVVAGRRDEWLCPHDIQPVLRSRPGGTLLAGFDGKSANGSSAGQRCSASSFGHLGFTGTSLWMDPSANVVLALLTNRVHPTRTIEAIKEARPEVHDALHAWATVQAA
ncbi:MAG: beta-lactamase family protein [Polyangiaceae bacterium]|jgi:CubicO group peptidase (beta-lactamase class C family)|nr:beta-lactamase family protein [Polyangiaceae bacterium]